MDKCLASEQGHGAVGNDQVARVWCGAKGLQRLGTAGADHDLVAQTLERRSSHVHEGSLIIDKQNPLVPANDRLLCGESGGARAVTPREVDGKCTALPWG